jgi:hypothetical protein
MNGAFKVGFEGAVPGGDRCLSERSDGRRGIEILGSSACCLVRREPPPLRAAGWVHRVTAEDPIQILRYRGRVLTSCVQPTGGGGSAATLSMLTECIL